MEDGSTSTVFTKSRKKVECSHRISDNDDPHLINGTQVEDLGSLLGQSRHWHTTLSTDDILGEPLPWSMVIANPGHWSDLVAEYAG